MQIENTLPLIEKLPEETKKYDELYQELAELDRDLSELVKLISLRGDGYKISQSIFNDYSKMMQNLDEIKTLNIKKSKYEDLQDCFTALENIYLEMEEIDNNCIQEPVIVIEDVEEQQPTEEVIEIEEKN